MGLLALGCVAACVAAGSEDANLLLYTIDGIRYEATFKEGADVKYSSIPQSDGTEITPFPEFLDGVVVIRKDEVAISDRDRAAAQVMAARYCGLDGRVPAQVEGVLLENGNGWYFGPCQASSG